MRVVGVRPRDKATFVAVGAGLMAVGLITMLLPAHRATRAQPVEALWAE
jgi:ABC-type antimicrobial peptide transport system permease subunit